MLKLLILLLGIGVGWVAGTSYFCNCPEAPSPSKICADRYNECILNDGFIECSRNWSGCIDDAYDFIDWK